MSHIEHEGKIYCDWRISLKNCEGSEFFLVVSALGGVFAAVACLCLVGALSIRKFVFEEKLRLFPSGENGLALLILNALLVFSIYTITVLGGWSDLLSGVLWTFLQPSSSIFMVYQLFFLQKVVPRSIFKKRNSKWQLSERAYVGLFLTFFAFVNITHVVLLSVSQTLSSGGQVSTGRHLQKVGFTFTSVNYLLLSAWSSYNCFSLRRKIQDVLKEFKEVSQREIDHTLLTLTAKKLRQNLASTVVHGAIIFIYFLLLAYYPGFFTNLPFSKAMMATLVATQTFNAMLYMIFLLFVDVKRWIFKKKVEGSLSKGSEKREREEMAARTVPSIKRDEVDLIIDDLKPKQSSQE